MLLKKNANFVIPTLQAPSEGHGFYNPLDPDKDIADPRVLWCEKTGYYYGISTGNTDLTLFRARTLDDLFKRGESKKIYEAKPEDDTWGYLWAPELHQIDGHWYIYTSTHQTATRTSFKHLIVLTAKTDDPFDGFVLGGHINYDVYAIDPTVYEWHGKWYICFSYINEGQYLAIQAMKSPTEVEGDFTIIARAEYPWELVPPYVGNKTINEGAFFVERDGRLFIIYSGNGCWSDDYVLGILELVGDDPLSAASWLKDDEPLVVKGNGNYGPGHATFFTSPDGKELWIAMHCLTAHNPSVTIMPRRCHCQRVFFDETGFPHIGSPISKAQYYPLPSGDENHT